MASLPIFLLLSFLGFGLAVEKSTLEPSIKSTKQAKTSSTTTTTTTTTPLNCANTTDGTACVFPFIYKENKYGACTTMDNARTPWCPTSVTESGVAWGWANCDARCSDSAPIEEESCKTVNGFDCAPEYHYNDVVYNNTCTMVDDSKAWCAITVYNDTLEANRYGYCNDNCTVAPSPSDSTCVTTSGQECKLPFHYNGVSYNNCTDVHNGNTSWCATSFYESSNYAKGWGNCNSTGCSICDEEIDQFNSLNYPNNYTDFLDEKWTFQVEEGYRIKVKFLAFVLEDDIDCDYDRVSIIDKKTSKTFGPFCDDTIPEDIISDSNQIEVNFTTDLNIVRSGFLASVIRIC